MKSIRSIRARRKISGRTRSFQSDEIIQAAQVGAKEVADVAEEAARGEEAGET
jgi:hypothetical protein